MSRTSQRRNHGFTLVELLVVIAIIGILVALLLPAVQAARESGRRSTCQNNMRQMAIAAHTFHDSKGFLPASNRPAGLTTAPRIGGLIYLLPFIEQGNIYNGYNQTLNWSDPANLVWVQQKIPVFLCPSTPLPDRLDGDPQITPWAATVSVCTDYSPTLGVDPRLVNLGLVDYAGNGMMPTSLKSRFADTIDGLSNTILYAESAGRPYVYRLNRLISSDLTQDRINGGGWPRPASDFTLNGSTIDGTSTPGPCAMNCTNGYDYATVGYPVPYYNTLGTGECYAFHPGGANIAFGDSSVHFVGASVNIRIFAALITRNKGEAYQAPIQ